MKRLLLLATVAACLADKAFEPIHVPPDERLALSRVSDHILVVEVTEVERKPPRKRDGLEFSDLVIRAKVIEVVRGAKKKDLSYEDTDSKVVDKKEFTKGKYGGTDLFDGPPASEETGSGECKVGERYVMLYLFGKAYFMHIRKGDDSWRRKILERIN